MEHNGSVQRLVLKTYNRLRKSSLLEIQADTEEVPELRNPLEPTEVKMFLRESMRLLPLITERQKFSQNLLDRSPVGKQQLHPEDKPKNQTCSQKFPQKLHPQVKID